MNTWSDDLLAAYVDGELDAPTRAALEGALAVDAALAARMAREHALRQQVEAAFGAVLDEPVPQRLLEALRVPVTEPAPEEAAVVDLAAARTARAARTAAALPAARPRWAWPEWGAMAACLVVGLFAGRALLPAAADPPFASGGDRLLARGALAQALMVQPAGPPATGGTVTLPVSFAAADGRYCRSFVLAPEALAGLACRTDAGWQLELLATAAQAAPPGTLRPAGSALPEAVLRAIDARIAGEPLDAAGERAALARGWRR